MVITPARTLRWNRAVADGNRPAYAYFAMAEKDYIALSLWLQDVLRYIRQQNAIIRAYEREIATHNESIAPAPTIEK